MSSREKEVLLSIINNYKDMPYLWQKEHKDYLKKDVRDKGFKVLLDIYKTFDQYATIRTIKKKIENMRTNYTKELRKVLASKEAGEDEVYVPTLWYFNAFSFLTIKSESWESYQWEFCPKVSDPLEVEVLSSDAENASTAPSVSGQKRKRNDTPIEKKETPPERQGNIFETAEKLVTNFLQKDDQWEVYGKSIGYQMKDLNEHQMVICQKIISDAIFYAKLNKLNENSHIVTPSNETSFHQHFYSSPRSGYSSPSIKVAIHHPSPSAQCPLQPQSPDHDQSTLEPLPSPSHQHS